MEGSEKYYINCESISSNTNIYIDISLVRNNDVSVISSNIDIDKKYSIISNNSN